MQKETVTTWLSGRHSYALVLSGILIAVAAFSGRTADGVTALVGPLAATIYVMVRISQADIDWNGLFSEYK